MQIGEWLMLDDEGMSHGLVQRTSGATSELGAQERT